MSRSSLLPLTVCALCTAWLAVCSWIALPGTVPVTMQSFALFLMLMLFPGRIPVLSVAVYLLLGMVGLPVFAGMQGGIGVILGPRGGFLLGFLLMTLLDRGIALLWQKRTTAGQLACIAAELLLCYAVGTLWYMKMTHTQSILAALSVCVLPFLLPDAIKLVLSFVVQHPIQKRLGHMLHTIKRG